MIENDGVLRQSSAESQQVIEAKSQRLNGIIIPTR